MRLPAFRLPFSFFLLVIASEAKQSKCSGKVLDCFAAPIIAMTVDTLGCLTKRA